MSADSTTVEPAAGSLLERVRARARGWRTWLRRGEAPQRKLELALVLVASAAVVPIGGAVWRPHVAPVELPAPAEATAEARCDDEGAHRFTSLFIELERAAANDAATAETSRLDPYRLCVGRSPAFARVRNDLLERAAGSGHLALVRWLRDRAHFDEDAQTAALAAADAYPDVVAFLRANGARDPGLGDAARRGAVNALARALEQRRYEPAELTQALRWFLQSRTGVDATAPADPDGRSAARPAGEDERVVRLLLSKGARFDGAALAALCTKREGVAPDLLGAALAARTPGAIEQALASIDPDASREVVFRLAAEGVDWDYHDGEDDAAMPLVRAVAARNETAMRLLVELGAPVNRFYKDGSSALESAVSCTGGDVCGRMTEYLLAHGAEPNRRFPDGATPLFAAAEAGDGRVIRALLDADALIDERVVRETPLDAAERTGNTTAARVLAARGARLSPR